MAIGGVQPTLVSGMRGGVVDPRRPDGAVGIGEVLLGAGVGAAELAWRAGRPLRDAGGGVLRSMWAVTTRLAPVPVTSALAERSGSIRSDLRRLVDAGLRLVVLRVVETLLESVDLTALVREHVDLDALAAELNIEAVVARVDLDAVVARVDLDAVVARVDLDAVVVRVDLDAIADRLDLDRLVAKVDIDAVAGRLDLDALAARIDPDPVVARVDLEAAIARIDLAGIAREVIDAIDLPDIVRDSTGTMASDAVRTVRVEGMQADDAVAGLVDRLLRRSRWRPSVVP
jgi:hypothetical protein